MKQILILIACYILCACNSHTSEHPFRVKDLAPPLSHPTKASKKEQEELMKAEVDYYLKRHSPEDEGYEMVSQYAMRGYHGVETYMPRQPFGIWGLLSGPTVKREGTGLERDSKGRFIIGTWQADTLVSGIRVDSTGIYAGHFNAHQEASGYGTFLASSGALYEGVWYHDMRHGFGMGLSAQSLQVGTWKNDLFRGERITHGPQRIYGIDISRYQHERGRKRFSIAWQRLRITNLGRHNSKPVSFPIQFVYIKSTEGLSIHNRYFSPDYVAAHRHGYKVGCYHFFSPKQDGAMQASYFLKQSRFQRGDLPPMLDVEPSDALIKQIGGPEMLFKNIRTWLRAVERQTGCRPIIYANQRFVKKYLQPEAPDLARDYHIWIARYGQFKPDARQTLWQLTATGRVAGIQTEVDINVFNGYQGLWDEFVSEECLK